MLYGTSKASSDKDIMVIYESLDTWEEMIYGTRHQFQWDDKENNTQYIFTTYHQFFRNILSGESTINVDYYLWDNRPGTDTFTERLNVLRTYNVIKAFLGYAKRDIKDLIQGKGKNKVFHIRRGLYCAECLMDGRLPDLEMIRILGALPDTFFSREISIKAEMQLREKCNDMYNSGELTLYPKETPPHPFHGKRKELLEALINSNNIKEFRYE